MKPHIVFSFYALSLAGAAVGKADRERVSAETEKRRGAGAYYSSLRALAARREDLATAEADAAEAGRLAHSAMVRSEEAIRFREEAAKRVAYAEEIESERFAYKEHAARLADNAFARFERACRRYLGWIEVRDAEEARLAKELPLAREAGRAPSFLAGHVGSLLRDLSPDMRRFTKRQHSRFNRRRNRAETLSYLGWGER